MIKIEGTAAVGGKRKHLNFVLRHATVLTFLSPKFWTNWYYFIDNSEDIYKCLARVAKDPDAELDVYDLLDFSSAGRGPFLLTLLHCNIFASAGKPSLIHIIPAPLQWVQQGIG